MRAPHQRVYGHTSLCGGAPTGGRQVCTSRGRSGAGVPLPTRPGQKRVVLGQRCTAPLRMFSIPGLKPIEFIPIKRQVLTEPVNPVLLCKCHKLLFPMVSEAW